MKRSGIYAGTFNPVHAGHVAFALQAMQAAKLDKVYFLPERRPRDKMGVEHFGHRVAMLKRALKPHPQFEVLELVDINFSVSRTLPRLQKQFGDDQLVFLMGSDVLKTLASWPDAETLIAQSEFVIGLRKANENKSTNQLISTWRVKPRATYLVDSFAPDISSSQIRRALYNRHSVRGLLRSVERYSNRHWLYVSLTGDQA